MHTKPHLNKAEIEGGSQRGRRSSQRPRRVIGVELMVLALSTRFGKAFSDDDHLRLMHLACELGARPEQLPEQTRAELAAANPFAKGYLCPRADSGAGTVLDAQHDQVQGCAGGVLDAQHDQVQGCAAVAVQPKLAAQPDQAGAAVALQLERDLASAAGRHIACVEVFYHRILVWRRCSPSTLSAMAGSSGVCASNSGLGALFGPSFGVLDREAERQQLQAFLAVGSDGGVDLGSLETGLHLIYGGAAEGNASTVDRCLSLVMELTNKAEAAAEYLEETGANFVDFGRLHPRTLEGAPEDRGTAAELSALRAHRRGGPRVD